MGHLKLLLLAAFIAVAAASSVSDGWVEPEYVPDELPEDATSGSLQTNVPTFLESQASIRRLAQAQPTPIQQMAPPQFYYAPRYVPYAYPAPQMVRMAPGQQVPIQPRFMSARARAGPPAAGEGAAPAPALPSALSGPSAAVLYPGPYGGSFHLLHDEMGALIPPYAQDPQFQRLGYYRPLSNKYSDGTSYPLNMQKFDYFPMGEGG